MNDTIYAPPEAEVRDQPTEGTPYFIVSVNKMVWLSILTMSLYQIYWFYRNWKAIKETTGQSVIPVLRAIFYFFFTHSLLNHVNRRLTADNKPFKWEPMILATVVVVAIIFNAILGQLVIRGIMPPWTIFLTFAVYVLIPVALIDAQRAMNLACNDPDGSENARFTGANYAWMTAGVVYWAWSIFNTYTMYIDPGWLFVSVIDPIGP